MNKVYDVVLTSVDELATVPPEYRQAWVGTRLCTVNNGESKTHQSFKDEQDVNKIIQRHRDLRIPLPSANLNYADISEITDYRDALDSIKRVQGIFEALPSASRAYFDNDVARFLDYARANTPDVVDALVKGPPVAEPVVTPAAAELPQATPQAAPQGPPAADPGPPPGEPAS